MKQKQKYEHINPELFVKNRAKFAAQMQDNALAVFNSNDVIITGCDSEMPFKQHRDIFYLSGIDQEESILVLFPQALNPDHREVLFVRETNATIAIWEGAKYTKAEATATSGIQTVYWLSDFPKIFFAMMAQAEKVYINKNQHYKFASEVQNREDRFIAWLQRDYPAHTYLKSNTILQRLRSVKEQEEIALIQTACDITEKGFRRLLSFIKPGVWEYEIEAELIHEFIKNRSKGFAYTPIIGSGDNANVLHYIVNNQQCQSGEMILLDVAAEYANYASDLTRTVPVNGRFTPRQLEVYNAVNHIKEEAQKLMVVGNTLANLNLEVGKMMNSALVDLKLIDKADLQNEDPKNPLYKKYFMHNTSHHMGLDTHDYGVLTDTFVENMVFAVEPAIYIPAEKFAVRLEDDVVIQKQGEPFNLMKNIPILAEEIEDLMNA
jgi:Xaa-Pro aminopeptidase